MATEIENNNNPVVLMDCIINEVYSVIARRSNSHDCLISLVMKEKGLTGILTLDKGFQVVPWIKVIG